MAQANKLANWVLDEVFINQNAEKCVFHCFLLSFLDGPLLNIKIILKSRSSIFISLIAKYKHMLGL